MSDANTANGASVQNPKVDVYVARAKRWHDEIQKLRAILLDCGLDEELRSGKPCFDYEGPNIAIIPSSHHPRDIARPSS